MVFINECSKSAWLWKATLLNNFYFTGLTFFGLQDIPSGTYPPHNSNFYGLISIYPIKLYLIILGVWFDYVVCEISYDTGWLNWSYDKLKAFALAYQLISIMEIEIFLLGKISEIWNVIYCRRVINIGVLNIHISHGEIKC